MSLPDQLDALFAGPADWLAPAADTPFVAVSSRVRLARNLADCPFPGRAAQAQREEVFRQVRAAAVALGTPPGLLVLPMPTLDALARQLLLERRLASRELTSLGAGSGLLLAPDGALGILVNEEDHLRVQAFARGLDLRRALTCAEAAEHVLAERLKFAFREDLGFLTACPSNVGTGMRASAMLHLPALVMAGAMEPVLRAAAPLRVAVRGFFGEGSEAVGNLFQVSNQGSLGESEEETLERLDRVIRRLADAEQALRQQLPRRHRERLYDQVGRAYGILRFARVLTSTDALNYLSLLLLGCDLGLFRSVTRAALQDLLLLVQPGHLQRLAGKPLEERARDVFRARIIRNRLETAAAA